MLRAALYRYFTSDSIIEVRREKKERFVFIPTTRSHDVFYTVPGTLLNGLGQLLITRQRGVDQKSLENHSVFLDRDKWAKKKKKIQQRLFESFFP